MIHIGDTKEGERVEIPYFHTAAFGQSGVGKTKLLKYMVSQAVREGYKVLIFDSKLTGAEFEGIGKEIPFYIEESTNPDVYQSLIEGMRPKKRGMMDRYRGGFIELCTEPHDAESFAEIGRRLKAKLEDTKHIKGSTRMMYKEINYDHGNLMKLLGHFPFARDVDITAPISRMPTTELPNLGLQGLVVGSTVDRLLRDQSVERLIFLVDEGPNFVSQKKYNPAKTSLLDLDTQGRKQEKWGWYSGTTLTGFDKSAMKNLWYWILGRQMEGNEVKDTFDMQSEKLLTKEEIGLMPVREFLVRTPEGTKLVKVPQVNEEQLFGREEPLPRMEEEDWTDVILRIQKLEAAVVAASSGMQN